MSRIVQAQAKFVRVSPTKASLVASLVRGKNAQNALEQLRLTPKAAAKPIYKALHSAVSNAENNHKLNPSKLVIRSITTTAGPSLKRYRPRARGSAASILKRSTHITVLVEEIEPVLPKKAVKKPAAQTEQKPSAKKAAPKQPATKENEEAT